jgi:ADP-ribosylglycohydrolase
MLGLAVGDALGTTLEFKAPGTFKPITDMIGGGPFGLEPGQWTDDTSMALCLAESLIEKRGIRPEGSNGSLLPLVEGRTPQ